MIDFGFDKVALIGAVALIVIGPEKLPRVARTVGHFIGKAQRYVADVKAEVNRSIELEEIQKMKSQMEAAARDVGQSVNAGVNQVRSGLNPGWGGAQGSQSSHFDDESTALLGLPPDSGQHDGDYPTPKQVRKNWRLKRSALPQWYRKRHGVRGQVLSGAARVARFRPRPGQE